MVIERADTSSFAILSSTERISLRPASNFFVSERVSISQLMVGKDDTFVSECTKGRERKGLPDFVPDFVPKAGQHGVMLPPQES